MSSMVCGGPVRWTWTLSELADVIFIPPLVLMFKRSGAKQVEHQLQCSLRRSGIDVVLEHQFPGNHSKSVHVDDRGGSSMELRSEVDDFEVGRCRHRRCDVADVSGEHDVGQSRDIALILQ